MMPSVGWLSGSETWRSSASRPRLRTSDLEVSSLGRQPVQALLFGWAEVHLDGFGSAVGRNS